jgi:hypothetical protein
MLIKSIEKSNEIELSIRKIQPLWKSGNEDLRADTLRILQPNVRR